MLNDYFAPTLYQALLAEVNWNLEMEYVSKNLLFILIRLLGKNEKKHSGWPYYIGLGFQRLDTQTFGQNC